MSITFVFIDFLKVNVKFENQDIHKLAKRAPTGIFQYFTSTNVKHCLYCIIEDGDGEKLC